MELAPVQNVMSETPEVKAEVHVDPTLDNVRCCFCCWKRNVKENKRFKCSTCCNRKIIFERSINRAVKHLSRFFTD